ncbi:MAG: AraC family transcriptional regulator [Bacteroidales bacterium]|nr:AraC family transcriptional regulator [Bacteroidales bacterium]
MKHPSYKKIGPQDNQVIEILEVKEPHFYPYWHFHPESEIMLLKKSTGTRYIGDAIDNFRAGDVVLLGPNIPHLWRSSKECFVEGSPVSAKATVIYFREERLGHDFFDLPEMAQIKKLLSTARRGVKFTGKKRASLVRKVEEIVNKEGMDRIVGLLSLLNYMAIQCNYQPITSLGYSPRVDVVDFSRFNRISAYLMNNFSKKIMLDEIAAVASMSPTAFCRYFKSRTNKTFVGFLNEIRIGHACKLLMEREKSASEICYESGFNNLTNFNIQFRKIKGMTPLQYQSQLGSEE